LRCSCCMALPAVLEPKRHVEIHTWKFADAVVIGDEMMTRGDPSIPPGTVKSISRYRTGAIAPFKAIVNKSESSTKNPRLSSFDLPFFRKIPRCGNPVGRVGGRRAMMRVSSREPIEPTMRKKDRKCDAWRGGGREKKSQDRLTRVPCPEWLIDD